MKIYNKPGSKERLLEMMKGVTKEDKVKINENIEKKEDSQPFGGSKQKYQDGMGYGDEKPVNPKLRVKAPELEKFVKEDDEQSGYDLPVGDDTVVIKINGYPWYLRKAGDSTHFYMSNNPQALNTGAAWASHIGEHRNKPYYNDIRAWLKGGESPTGKEYDDPMTMGEAVKDYWDKDEIPNTSQTKQSPKILEPESSSKMNKDYSRDNFGGYFEGEEEKEIEDAELDPTDANNNGDFVEGGLADDADIEQFDPQQISMGIEVEMEHTKDPKVALEIAMDHLMELPDYYTKLKAMEDKGEDELDGDGGMPGVDSDEEGNPIPATDPNFSDMGMDNEESPEEFADDREEMEGEFSQYFDDLKSADDELKNNLVGFDIETPNTPEEDSKYDS